MDRRTFIRGVGLGTLAANALANGKLARALMADDKGTPGETVATGSGKVRGLAQNKVQVFKGIRYGASTEGAGRFMPPAKVAAWTNVKEVYEFGPRAPQLNNQFKGQVPPEFESMDPEGPMSEDCLCLNLWTASVGRTHQRPVMVWLHGGGFTTGSGAFICYDGTELARKHDVVAITLNHRLNVFGYLYLPEVGGGKYANASNVGMLDIVAALEWVRDNVEAFGGDPNNVTIFGQSGGGGKVSALMAMPSAKGLFHRAIVESGADVRGVPAAAGTKSAEAFIAKLGLQPNQVDQLQAMPIDQLLTTMGSMTGGGAPGAGGLALAPVVDGTTETEVTFFPGQILDPIDAADLHARVKQTLRVADDSKVDDLIAVYRKDRPDATNTDLYLIIASDATFRAGVLVEADRKAQQDKAPCYQYYFTWRSPVRDGKLRSFHTLEIPFVFDNVDAAQSMTGDGSDRHALAAKVSGAWVAFARTGDPNHAGIPHWPPFDTTARSVMIINDEWKVVDDPHGDSRRALQALQHA
jgi:para-nitrobenzyl esterase